MRRQVEWEFFESLLQGQKFLLFHVYLVLCFQYNQVLEMIEFISKFIYYLFIYKLANLLLVN